MLGPRDRARPKAPKHCLLFMIGACGFSSQRFQPGKPLVEVALGRAGARSTNATCGAKVGGKQGGAGAVIW